MRPDSEVCQVLKGSGTLISKGRQQTQMQKDLDFPISESRLHLITQEDRNGQELAAPMILEL